MRIGPSPSAPLATPATSQLLQAAHKTEAPVKPTASVTVAISGQTLLRERVFNSYPDFEPPFLDIKKAGMVLKPELYLNMEDRALLAEMYEFAQSENIHLNYVDHLGRELAEYRGSDNGVHRLPHNRGGMFDMQGHMLSYTFTDVDARAAQRARDNPGIATTRLDNGFLSFQTDDDYSSMSHCDFDFLDLVISRFSASPESAVVSGRFQTHQYMNKNYIEHVSTEVYDFRNLSGKKGDPDVADKPASKVSDPVPSVDLSSSFRQIMRQYLQKSGLPTLFETLMRMGR